MDVSLFTGGEKGKICQHIRCAGTDSKQTIKQKAQHKQSNVTVKRLRLTTFAVEIWHVLNNTSNEMGWACGAYG